MESLANLYTKLAREAALKSAETIQQLADPKALKPNASVDKTNKRPLPPKKES